MRALLWLTLLPLTLAASAHDSRGVRPATAISSPTQPAAPFDRRQSAALFVGVREFDEGTAGQVKYTVDDAVDLAYTMAVDRRVGLVAPSQVALAITGRPRKAESQARLQRLERAGAAITWNADRATILRLAEEQARAAGANGALIYFFASHGFTSEGTAYILGSDSRFNVAASSLSTAKLFDIAAASAARRSLIFVDACRERIPGGARGRRYYDEAGTAPMIERMTPLEGQVIFFAAAAGLYAFEEETLRQGVFTHAVLEGLACKAEKQLGFVTAATLARYVENRVGDWVRRRKDSRVTKATQVLLDGGTQMMPLAHCTTPPAPDRIAWNDRSITAFDKHDDELWTRELPLAITHAKLADLHDDKSNDVIVAAGANITVFDADGSEAWSRNSGDALAVKTFIADYVYSRRQKRQIVALASSGTATSRIVIYDADGSERASYAHAGPLDLLAVDKLTARHNTRFIVTGSRDGAPLGVRGPMPTVFALDRNLKEEWYGALTARTITALDTLDHDNDRRRDIAVSTEAGTIHLTFDGKVMQSEGVRFVPIATP